jgi:hypothetical protein
MWTTTDIRYLREHASLGASELAMRMGRSPAAVKRAAGRFRISLRRPGSRRGSVLGQPRGVSLRRELRTDLTGGRVDPEVLATRMRLDADAELCPLCVARPIRVIATGLCRVCHLRELAEAHREAIEELEAQRELWTARQQLKRARERAGGEGEGRRMHHP